MTAGRPMNVMVTVLPGRLSLWSSPKEAMQAASRPMENSRCFRFDGDYESFYADFGPMKLSTLYRYCQQLDMWLNSPENMDVHIIHYTPPGPKRFANAVCLMCMYQVVVRCVSAEEAFRPFLEVTSLLAPFRDALPGPSTFDLSVLDCLQGLERSIQMGWFQWGSFNSEAYDYYDAFDDMGLNWIIPNKLLAFGGPRDRGAQPAPGNGADGGADDAGAGFGAPEDYVSLFKEAGIGLVIRLNSTKSYDRRIFIENGIKHLDLYFKDGSCPSADIVAKFLYAVEMEPGPVAVHCMAGLGRTVSLIGVYAMKHYQFRGRAFIGWSRLCRPGSVLGPQQQFLVDMEAALRHCTSLVTPSFGDDGQGQRLRSARLYCTASIAEAVSAPPPPALALASSLPSLLKKTKSNAEPSLDAKFVSTDSHTEQASCDYPVGAHGTNGASCVGGARSAS